MRVVHVGKVTGIAGSERQVLRLLPGLAAAGVDVHMVLLEEPRRPVDLFRRSLEACGVPVHTVPIRGDLDPQLVGRLTRQFKVLRPDLVHTHLIHADLYGLWAAARAGVPHAISSRHNNDAFRLRVPVRLLTRILMRRAARVIANSQAVARFVRDVDGVEPARVVTVYYGLNPPRPAPDAAATARAALGLTPRARVVGIIGRAVRQKGIDVLLEAFPRVRARYPEARLVVIGDGPLRADLETQARRLGLAQTALFTGWIEEACTLIAAFDLVVVPSRWEGFGLVTLEAMGHARPVVASRVDALPEIIIDGETGVLVPPEDGPALANAVNGLLGDPERSTALGRAGYARLVARFPVENMIRATMDVYGDVMRCGVARKSN